MAYYRDFRVSHWLVCKSVGLIPFGVVSVRQKWSYGVLQFFRFGLVWFGVEENVRI